MRAQGGLFTSAVDSNPTHTALHAPPDLTSVHIIDFDVINFIMMMMMFIGTETLVTQVHIIDFDVINFINFETEIRFAEASGIVQV